MDSGPPVDVLIIGGGPAGLSAALTLVRQNHSVLVLDKGITRALPSAKLHGMQGADAKSPQSILDDARAELSKYSNYELAYAEVIDIRKSNDMLEARDVSGNVYSGKRVILANGVEDCFPDIEGYAEAWGKRIFHNPFAQGYQQDEGPDHAGVLAVDWIATPKYALHLTHLVAQLRSIVTLYTHGNAELASQLQSLLSQSIEKAALVKVDSRRLARLSIKEACAKTVDITFADGTVCEESFLGHAPITKLNGPFAAQLNINVSRTGAEYIVSGPTNATNVKGVYAAGDSTNMLKVWPGAVASGAVTAAGVAIGLQEETWGFSSIFE